MNENAKTKSKIESQENPRSENNDHQCSVQKKSSRTNHRLAMSNKSCLKHAEKMKNSSRTLKCDERSFYEEVFQEALRLISCHLYDSHLKITSHDGFHPLSAFLHTSIRGVKTSSYEAIIVIINAKSNL